MSVLSPFNGAFYLARFSNAVVPQDDFMVIESVDAHSMQFDLFLLDGVNFNFSAVDDEGGIGMIFILDRLIPQGVNKDHIRVEISQLFDDFTISESPGDQTILILHVEDDARVGITANGDDLHLIRVSWPL
jgi:hypothetical protein